MKKNFLALFLLTACVSSVLVVKSADFQYIQDLGDDNQIAFGGRVEGLEDDNQSQTQILSDLGVRMQALEYDNKSTTLNLADLGVRMQALEVDKTKTQTLTNLAQLSRRVEVLEKNGQLSGRFDSVKKSQASSQRLPMSDRLFGFVGASATVTSVAKWTGFATPFVTKIAPLISNLSGMTSLSYVGVVAKGACAGLTYAGSYAGAGLTYAGSYACAFYGLPMLVLVKYSYDMYCMKDQITKDKIPLLEITKKIFKKNCNLVINTIVPVAKLAGGLVILGMLAAKK